MAALDEENNNIVSFLFGSIEFEIFLKRSCFEILTKSYRKLVMPKREREREREM